MHKIPLMPYRYRWDWTLGDISLAKIWVQAWIEANPVKDPAATQPDWSVSHICVHGLAWTRTVHGDAGLAATEMVLPETDPNHERILLALFTTPRHREEIDRRWAEWVANPPLDVARMSAAAQAVAP